MDIINIKFDQAEAEIGSLGMQGENKKVALHIDCSSVLEKHPGAAILVNYDPRLPGEPYFNLPVTALENGIYEAVLTPMELACDGLKRIQVRAVEGDYEDRSKTFIAYVEKSVYDFRPPAGPVSDWLDQLRDALAKADAAQQHGPVIGTNGNWYVWKTGAYVDTGVKAEGKDGATGATGKDGYSPVLTVTEIAGGRRITITDANGTKTFDVLNGENATDEQVREVVGSYLAANPLVETDPTVPAWAKAESKPSYSYNELTDKPTIPAAYNLPVASESELGGVKPISKTDDMTQGVGVDSEGKLWALPGGGSSGGSGGIPAVTTEGTGAAYTATIPEITELYNGLTISVAFHTTNTTHLATFDLNGYGGTRIYTRNLAKSLNELASISPSSITTENPVQMMYYANRGWIIDQYSTVSVSGGGTGKNSLTSGSYLVGNGTSAVNLKTPAKVLSDILPSTAADVGKVPTVQADGTIALAEVSGGGGASVHIGPDQPTNGEMHWLDTSDAELAVVDCPEEPDVPDEPEYIAITAVEGAHDLAETGHCITTFYEQYNTIRFSAITNTNTYLLPCKAGVPVTVWNFINKLVLDGNVSASVGDSIIENAPSGTVVYGEAGEVYDGSYTTTLGISWNTGVNAELSALIGESSTTSYVYATYTPAIDGYLVLNNNPPLMLYVEA